MAGPTPLLGADVLRNNFEASTPTYNPWAGVTDTGLIKVLSGIQPAVNDDGTVRGTDFGPSVAVGDLNGDDLPDLVIGDARGFFWYFPNSGTKGQPKFTHGEVMPIWLGFDKGDPNFLDFGGEDNIVPKIQLVDLAGDRRLLSLVVGNYVGRLFYIPNLGNSSMPVFRMPGDRGSLIVPTHRKGVLWCNYLAPFLYDWHGTGNLDLIMGDGSYSANSIYLLTNKGSREQPIFNEDSTAKIIPGMGREHLTPQVVDWNNDGKPDIITGERTSINPAEHGAHVNVFLNNSTDPAQPTFAPGQPVQMGSKNIFDQLTTVDVNDLASNKLPNLIVTTSKGDILYAQNTGKLGAPQFGDPVPLRGINPFPKILRPVGWQLYSPHGVPHELLVCTNATVQEGFTPPPNTTFKNAMRYYVYPIKNTYFTSFFYPQNEIWDISDHVIRCDTGFQLMEGTEYKVSFWVRSAGNIRNLKYTIRGRANFPDDSFEAVDMIKEIGSTDSWNLFEDTTSFRLKNPQAKPKQSVGLRFEVHFEGQGEVYLDDVWIRTAD